MFYRDLSPYEYMGAKEPNVYNIGWLDADEPFEHGIVPQEVLLNLLQLSVSPVNETRGWHTCPFCHAAPPITIRSGTGTIQLGDAEVRVRGRDGRVYAAPNLLYHYIEKHGYRPPAEFVEALIALSLRD
jgi:hypothetical protein